MRFRILSQTDVRASIRMPEAIDAMCDAFVQLASGRAHVPPRVPLHTREGDTFFMPAHLEATGDLGAKVVSVYGTNNRRGLPAIHAAVLVLDAATGAPRAVLDGTYLTALRTGATSGLATRLLARPDASTLALFGAGAQARTQLEAIRLVRPIREVRIVSRTHESAVRFAREIPADDLDVRVLDDPAAAAEGADIIVAATTSPTPVFPGSAVLPGTHINGIGSYTPTMQEIDAELLRRARIIVDSRPAALAEAGDLIIPIRNGMLMPQDIVAELGAVADGRVPGRTSDDEITFFKSVGNAVQDIAIAQRVLEAAETHGLGSTVEL